jgi:hypothetical protein
MDEGGQVNALQIVGLCLICFGAGGIIGAVVMALAKVAAIPTPRIEPGKLPDEYTWRDGSE